ncbi:MAG TPA: hypothetical protein VGO47_05975 [Chlamydiales bacterium]|nr:hypothetical protein [Chlamydiales bacterium]
MRSPPLLNIPRLPSCLTKELNKSKKAKKRPTPPPTHVHLILSQRQGGGESYLEIPIAVVMKLVVRPLKYLRFLGWCVMGNVQNLEWQKVVNEGEGEPEWVPVEDMDSPDFLEKHNRTYRYGEAKGACA